MMSKKTTKVAILTITFFSLFHIIACANTSSYCEVASSNIDPNRVFVKELCKSIPNNYSVNQLYRIAGKNLSESDSVVLALVGGAVPFLNTEEFSWLHP